MQNFIKTSKSLPRKYHQLMEQNKNYQLDYHILKVKPIKLNVKKRRESLVHTKVVV